GIFMLRRWELEWFYQEGASRLFPDAWEHYLKAIPEVERHDLISAFHRRLTSDDEATRLAAARAWSVWEGATSFLHVDPDFAESHADAHFALAFARIENHYFVNGGFFEVDDQLLRDAPKIADIPGVIVPGRYDVVCPIHNAWDLHKAWPKAELMISPASGHSAFEPENVDARVRATDGFAWGARCLRDGGPGTGDRGQGTGDRGQGTGDRGQARGCEQCCGLSSLAAPGMTGVVFAALFAGQRPLPGNDFPLPLPKGSKSVKPFPVPGPRSPVPGPRSPVPGPRSSIRRRSVGVVLDHPQPGPELEVQ